MKSTRSSNGLVLLALLSPLLLIGCSGTLPRSDPGVQCPAIPPLSPQARQPTDLAPFLANALSDLERWSLLLEGRPLPEPAAKPSTTPSPPTK